MAAEFGPRVSVERPPANDEGRLLGPHCFDADARVYLKVGANVTFTFWGASVENDFETAPLSIYRGPCWGYTGTINHTRTGTDPYDPYGGTYNDSYLITPDATRPARYKDGTISQPHQFSGTEHLIAGWDNGMQLCNDNGRDVSGAGTEEYTGGSIVQSWLIHYDSDSFVGEGANAEHWAASGQSWTDFECSGERVYSDVVANLAPSPVEAPHAGGVPATLVGDVSSGEHVVNESDYNLTRIEVPR